MERPLSDRQIHAKFVKPLHSSTNRKNLVKIRSIAAEIDLLQVDH